MTFRIMGASRPEPVYYHEQVVRARFAPNRYEATLWHQLPEFVREDIFRRFIPTTALETVISIHYFQ